MNSGHSLKSLISLKPYFQPGGENVRRTSRCQFYRLANTQCVSIPHLPKLIPLSTETEPLQIRLGLGLGLEQMVLQNGHSSRCWNGEREKYSHCVPLFCPISFPDPFMICSKPGMPTAFGQCNGTLGLSFSPSLGFFFHSYLPNGNFLFNILAH